LFLAGGLDSSLIAKLSGVKEAFTCQFDEFRDTIDEETYVRDLGERLGIEVHFVRPTREQFLHDLPAMSYHLEMPTGSFSVFPLYRLAKACHDRSYKVVLSGEGSDELFAGYARNELLLAKPGESDSDKQRHYAAMLDRFHGSDLDRFCRMASRSGLAGAGLMKMFLADHWSARRSMLENMAYLESRIFLQPLLQMADRMCMAHSVENRCPFLDHRLVEFAFSLDDSLRFRDGVGKWIVHRAAEKLLPRGSLVLKRRIKDGLPTPVNLWMHGIHSFDRKHWNALMTAECIKSLLAQPVEASIPVTRSLKEVTLGHSLSSRPASASAPGSRWP
jgi:asparagine synthase (glutamine-hydrolysing)